MRILFQWSSAHETGAWVGSTGYRPLGLRPCSCPRGSYCFGKLKLTTLHSAPARLLKKLVYLPHGVVYYYQKVLETVTQKCSILSSFIIIKDSIQMSAQHRPPLAVMLRCHQSHLPTSPALSKDLLLSMLVSVYDRHGRTHLQLILTETETLRTCAPAHPWACTPNKCTHPPAYTHMHTHT